jgi:uncharacterized protein
MLIMVGRREVGAVLPARPRPEPDVDTEFFWRSGADGTLRMSRCADCGYITHPPGPRCKSCRGTNVLPTPLSGRGIVWSFTVNMQRWFPGQDGPYIVAGVELVEQSGLVVTTNLVDVDGDDVDLGMEVEVVFEYDGEFYYPLFRPVSAS